MNKINDDKIFYHYCSASTLLNIVMKKQLWLTDISKSNDYAEMKIFMPDIFYAIEQAYEDDPFDYTYGGKTGILAIKKLMDAEDELLHKAFARGSMTSFVVCFCEKGDSLSQWRGYGNDGKGFSIGFSLEELKQYCTSQDGQLHFEPVIYINRVKRKEIINLEAKRILDKIRNIKKDNMLLYDKLLTLDFDEESYAELENILVYGIFERFVFDSLKYKWDSFKEEREWRLFFIELTKDPIALFADDDSLEKWQKAYDKNLNVLRGKVEFYAKDNCITPFFPVSINEPPNVTIKQLVIGPKNISYDQDLKLLFSREGLSIPSISYSDITYR